MKKIRQDSSLESISLIASIEDLNCLQFPSSKPKREKEGEKQLLFSFLVPPGFFSASVSFCLFSSRLSSPSLPLSSSLFLSLPLSLFLSYVLLLFFCWSWFLNFQFCCFLPSSQILFWLLFPSDLYITSLSFIPFYTSGNILPIIKHNTIRWYHVFSSGGEKRLDREGSFVIPSSLPTSFFCYIRETITSFQVQTSQYY